MKNKIPKGMTEEEVLTTIENICNKLAPKFVFGFHTLEDIKQEAFIEAWKGLDAYDGSHPLENFLSVHIKNRLCNFKRDNFERPDKPCLKCPLGAYNTNLPSECEKFNNKMDCELYKNWADRNVPKKNLVNCIDIDNVDDHKEARMSTTYNIVDTIEGERIISLIDEKLPMNLRVHYLRIKAGQKVNKANREAVQQAIREILNYDI